MLGVVGRAGLAHPSSRPVLLLAPVSLAAARLAEDAGSGREPAAFLVGADSPSWRPQSCGARP